MSSALIPPTEEPEKGDADSTYTSQVQPSPSRGFFTPENLNRILLVLGFLGIFDASLLSAEILLKLNLNCGADGGCATVANHPSAYWFHIPVAYFGFAAYVTFTALASFRAIRGFQALKSLLSIGYGMAVVGALVSVYLQYVALVKIGAFCPYCFGSAVNMILTAITYALLANAVRHLDPSAPRSGSDATWVGLGALATVVSVLIGSSVLQSTKAVPTVVTKEKDLKRLLPTPGDVHTYGDPKSKIKITEFADLCCIHCQMLTPKLDEFIDKHPGKVWTVFRQFPLTKPHPMALTAALVSEYAAKKGKFWDYANRVFAGGVELTTWDEVAAPAIAVGLDPEAIKKEINLSDAKELDVVQKDISDGDYFGINSTPTFFIETPGRPIHVATASDLFDVLTSSPYKEILGK